MPNPERWLTFLQALAALKTTVRRGWVRDGVRDAESVADHSYGVALLALVLPPPAGVDRDHAIRLALVHDLAEARTGDLVPGELPPAEKLAREQAAIAELAALLPDGDRLQAHWAEYAAGETAVARFVKDLDRLEMLLQAHAYEVAGNPGPLDSFWASERNRLADPTLADFLAWLETQRPADDLLPPIDEDG